MTSLCGYVQGLRRTLGIVRAINHYQKAPSSPSSSSASSSSASSSSASSTPSSSVSSFSDQLLSLITNCCVSHNLANLLSVLLKQTTQKIQPFQHVAVWRLRLQNQIENRNTVTTKKIVKIQS